MKKSLQKTILFTSMILLTGKLFAQNEITDVKKLVNPAYYDTLMKEGVVIEMRDECPARLDLLPNIPDKSKVTKNLITRKEGNYSFTYEALYYLNKQDLLKSSKSSAKTIDIQDVSRVCRSISKMEGMTYYSSTRRKDTILYKNAFTIADATSSEPIPDKNTGNADGQTLYAYQDDNSFGVTRYELHYNQSEKELLAVFKNKDTMGIGPFKAIYPDDMTINLLVIDCGENLLLYICDDLDSVRFPGIKNQITDSMSTRMEAVYKWFLKQF